MKKYITIKDMPSIKEGAIFVYNPEAEMFQHETEDDIYQYSQNDIDKNATFFAEFNEEELDAESIDDNLITVAGIKDIIDALPMEHVANIYNYIQSKRLAFFGLVEIKEMINESAK